MTERRFPLRIALFLSLAMASVLMGEDFRPNAENVTAPQRERRRPADNRRAYKTRIAAHWFDGGNRFWYRNDLPGGLREYILVDAIKGIRSQAFDSARLATALKNSGLKKIQAGQLDLQGLEFDLAGGTISFRIADENWQCDLDTYELSRIEKRNLTSENSSSAIHPADAPRASTQTGAETELQFMNRTNSAVELYWLDTDGQRRSYGKLAAGGKRSQHTFAGHVWMAVDAAGRDLAAFQAETNPGEAIITGKEIPRRQRRRPRRTNLPPRDLSPDGKWRAFTRENNVFLRETEGGKEIQLSRDGEAGQHYEMLAWTPDSKTLVAFRVQPGEQKEVFRIESSPPEGGRAKLHRSNYALPGDRFTSYELNLFQIAEEKQIKPDVERIDFGRPRLRFHPKCGTVTYEKTDRGHQRFRVVEVETKTGKNRNLIDEKSKTFIWTGHAQDLGVPLVNWLEQTEEIIYLSERDGWRHLYLIDANTGELKNQITQGEFVVRGVDQIDEAKRQIWFRGSGKNADQDPYFIHYYRVNFDGSGLVALTEGNGNHRIEFSPDRHFLIDAYSRVDMAPVHELRRVEDGRFICKLETADVSELEATGWRMPEVFSAKGRDGKTDIWGIICRPRQFDPAKKYPIIEDIYAGPHDSFVPKSFSTSSRYSSLTELGFIVVKIDGMGTANRSKAFHDVCWHNLKDAGFPDRISWIQAAAKKYPHMDASRVGIYGTSAGGQNAAAAVLFHPEFYRAAFAACGCHDNRMDKASWNEQWMGYPVGPQYARCSNIENARRLEGHLMLLVGEMDTNVPPESTLRFADALIKAGKDFDLIVIPGAGHTNGGNYGQRRMRDFFVRHLQGSEPPDRNQPRSKRS